MTRKEFELLWNQSTEQYNEVFGADDPDLTRFKEHGGKLLLLHGLADEFITPQGTIDYYQRVQKRMGGLKKTMEFARLFLLPGIDHAVQGPGPKPIDHFESLIKWTEEGKAPEYISAELREQSGKLVRSRSYVPYTEKPKIQTITTSKAR